MHRSGDLDGAVVGGAASGKRRSERLAPIYDLYDVPIDALGGVARRRRVVWEPVAGGSDRPTSGNSAWFPARTQAGQPGQPADPW